MLPSVLPLLLVGLLPIFPQPRMRFSSDPSRLACTTSREMSMHFPNASSSLALTITIQLFCCGMHISIQYSIQSTSVVHTVPHNIEIVSPSPGSQQPAAIICQFMLQHHFLPLPTCPIVPFSHICCSMHMENLAHGWN